MGFDYSLSFHEGDSFSLQHDNPEKIPPNVEPSRIAENIVYEGNIPLQKFYEETFQKAYEEYIQKQIKNRHPERVKGWPKTYYEFIKQKQMEQEALKKQMKLDGKHVKDIHEEDKYQRIAKQLIVQVGNIDDFENLSPQEQQELRGKMKEILREYMETFQKENPSFIIVNAVVHCDEVSLSPHLHLTYVPVSEPKKGQAIQNSINGALKAMGFHTDKEKDSEGVWMTAQMKWQKKERDRMVGIAKRHGLSIGYESGSRAQTRTLQDYQRDRQKERDEALAAREATVAEQQEQLDHRETVVQKKEQMIEDRKDKLNAHLQSEKARMDGEYQKLADREAEVEEREAILQAEAEASVTSLKKEISAVTASLRPSPGKRVEEYPAAPLKKGHRIVPDKDLDVLVERSWFSLSHIKKSVDQIIDKFNELPFVRAARATITRLEQKILDLQSQLQERDETIKEQDVLLNKAKTLKIDTFGKSMYDRLVEEVAKDRQIVSDMYDHEDDRSGR